MNEKQFVSQFLMWYYDSTSLPDKVNEVRIDQLAFWARGIEAKNLKKTVKKLEKSGKIKHIPLKRNYRAPRATSR